MEALQVELLGVILLHVLTVPLLDHCHPLSSRPRLMAKQS
jgi:hypothetical protein